MRIPFNRPHMTGRELEYIAEAHEGRHLSGDGRFTAQCHDWLERTLGCGKALLTHSCTGALEMTALLASIVPGDEVIMPSFTFVSTANAFVLRGAVPDEVIMPSFTFVSTANAFVLRGAVPVFVDIREDTLNIDERVLEEAITERTKAIVVVHYAGIACEMDAVLAVAERHRVLVIEDAAHGMMARYRGRALGSMGALATLSFHETKNVISGEGGALLVNEGSLIPRAEVIREKGTDRSRFMRGQVDKYTWIDVGSSFLPSEITAAFLFAQMQGAEAITERRLGIWHRYHAAFAAIEAEGRARRPVVPEHCTHNAHLYYLLLPSLAARSAFIAEMDEHDINCVFHYVPLHSSPAGARYGRVHAQLRVTERTSQCLVRLPLWLGLEESLDRVAETAISAIRRTC